jgi:hypothetical protein
MLQELSVSITRNIVMLNWYTIISSQSPRFLSRNSVASMVTRFCDLGCESQWWQETFLFFNTSKPALRPTQLPTQWLLGALFLVVQQPQHEAEHFPSSSTKVNNEWSYIYTSLVSLQGACRENFTFTLDIYVVFQ